MTKIGLVLALYAAAVATLWLVERGSGSGSSAARAGRDADAERERLGEPARHLNTRARDLLRAEVRDVLKNVDWRLGQVESLRKATEEGLAETQRAAEDAARGSYSKLEALEEEFRRMKALSEQIAGLVAGLEALRERVTELEARPAQVVREIAPPGAPVPTPPAPQPGRPTLPTEPPRDPAVVAAEVAKARQDIQSDDLQVMFPAIEKIRQHRVLVAVPRLFEILRSYRDEFGRTAAAAALGDMGLCDAVPALADALIDKSDLVAQQANKSLRQITGFDTQMSATARIRERRAARGRAKEWWAKNEAAVRTRLGQLAEGGR